MKKALLIICFVIISWVTGYAQGFCGLRNPSFESNSGCPITFRQFEYVNSWFNVLDETRSEPDYFNFECASTNVFNYEGYTDINGTVNEQETQHLCARAGIYLNSSFNTQFRSYMGQRVDLEAGVTYELKINLSESGVAQRDFVVYGYNGLFPAAESNYCLVTADSLGSISRNALTNTPLDYIVSFTPTKNYDYIILGAQCGTPITISSTGYLFIDKTELYSTSDTSAFTPIIEFVSNDSSYVKLKSQRYSNNIPCKNCFSDVRGTMIFKGNDAPQGVNILWSQSNSNPEQVVFTTPNNELTSLVGNTVLTPGFYTFYYTFSNGDCSLTDSIIVDVKAPAVITAGPDVLICGGNNDANFNNGIVSYYSVPNSTSTSVYSQSYSLMQLRAPRVNGSSGRFLNSIKGYGNHLWWGMIQDDGTEFTFHNGNNPYPFSGNGSHQGDIYMRYNNYTTPILYFGKKQDTVDLVMHYLDICNTHYTDTLQIIFNDVNLRYDQPSYCIEDTALVYQQSWNGYFTREKLQKRPSLRFSWTVDDTAIKAIDPSVSDSIYLVIGDSAAEGWHTIRLTVYDSNQMCEFYDEHRFYVKEDVEGFTAGSDRTFCNGNNERNYNNSILNNPSNDWRYTWRRVQMNAFPNSTIINDNDYITWWSMIQDDGSEWVFSSTVVPSNGLNHADVRLFSGATAHNAAFYVRNPRDTIQFIWNLLDICGTDSIFYKDTVVVYMNDVDLNTSTPASFSGFGSVCNQNDTITISQVNHGDHRKLRDTSLVYRWTTDHPTLRIVDSTVMDSAQVVISKNDTHGYYYIYLHVTDPVSGCTWYDRQRILINNLAPSLDSVNAGVDQHICNSTYTRQLFTLNAYPNITSVRTNKYITYWGAIQNDGSEFIFRNPCVPYTGSGIIDNDGVVSYYNATTSSASCGFPSNYQSHASNARFYLNSFGNRKLVWHVIDPCDTSIHLTDTVELGWDFIEPVVNAGPDVVANCNSIQLRGNLSATSATTAGCYLWRQVGGPAPVRIIDSNSNTAYVVGLENVPAGDYFIEYNLGCDVCAKTDTMVITVNSNVTKGNFTLSSSVNNLDSVCIGDTIEFTSSGATLYAWFVDGIRVRDFSIDSTLRFTAHSDTLEIFVLSNDGTGSCIASTDSSINFYGSPCITNDTFNVCHTDVVNVSASEMPFGYDVLSPLTSTQTSMGGSIIINNTGVSYNQPNAPWIYDTARVILRDSSERISDTSVIIYTNCDSSTYISCFDTTIYLDSNGSYIIDTSFILDSFYATTGIDSVWQSDSIFDCSTDKVQVSVYIRSKLYNKIDSCISEVRILDTINPLISCSDTTVYLDANGMVSWDTSYLSLTLSDNCGLDSVWISENSSDCSNASVFVTTYVRDNSGNIDSCESEVRILDTTNPLISCSDTTVYLDVNGMVSWDTSYLSLSISDNCGIDSVWISENNSDCSNASVSVTTYVRDNSGNIDSCESEVRTLDTTNPLISCSDTTVYLDVNGIVNWDISYLSLSISDNCGIDSVWISENNSDCSNASVSVTTYVRDNSGNIDSCESEVRTLDTTNPLISCSDTTVYLDVNGMVNWDTSYLSLTLSDNCGIDSVWISENSSDCNNASVSVTTYVRDNSGNIDSCESEVRILDTINPLISCNDTTVYLDISGMVSWDTSYLSLTLSDNCGIDSVWISENSSDCSNASVSVTTYVRDNSGNIDSCESEVGILDTIKPLISCGDTIVYLDVNGMVSWDTSYLSLTLSDNCGIDSVWISENNSDCSNSTVSVITYVRDNSGNIDSCESEVRILDTINPLISCSDTTVYLDANGAVSWDTSYLSLTLADNCGIDSVWISENSSGCNNTSVLVTTYVRDNSGNIDSCESEVRILDTINPLISCSDATVYLDANGMVSWDTSYLSLTLSDNCGIDSVWLSENSSDCSNDRVLVTTYVRDNSGNIDFCKSEVRISDSLSSNINCKDTVVYLNMNGVVSWNSSHLGLVVSDNCGIDSIWLSDTSSDCSNDRVLVTTYVRSRSGNIDSCISEVRILDTINPLISCSDTTVYLDINGAVSWDTSYLSLSISDNCGIDSVWISENNSDCSNSTVSVTTYVRDNSGNIDSCESEVRILDTINPLISCSDTTVYLDANGTVRWDTSYLSLILSDNCGIDSVWISENNSDCSNASVLVTTYVRDNSGNIDSCESEVRILDTLIPLISCSDTTVYLDISGMVSWDTSYLSLTLSDNCGIDSVWISENSSDCSNDRVLVTTYVRDNSGNIDSCESEVRILDTINPLISCSDTTIYIDVNGTVSWDTSYLSLSISDNCGIDSVWISENNSDCSNSTVSVTTYVRDNSGNIDSCESEVRILDTTNPLISCSDTTVYLDVNGIVNWDISYLSLSISDNCGIDSVWISENNSDCSNASVSVTTYVRDNSGNIDSCESEVRILDTINPLISCSDTTVYLDANGLVSWDTSYLSLTLSDNCGIDSVWLSDTSSDCSNASVLVTTYVRDNSGNIDSCESEVRILDTLIPLISCSDTTVYLDANGTVRWDTSYLSLILSDNCGIDSVWLSENSSDCSNASISVTTYVRDNSGNIDSCESEVRTLDTTNPLISCSDTTVYLDVNGAVSWDTSYLSLTLSDNCGIDSVWISENNSDCSNASVFVTTYVRDNSGNIDSCESEVRILDTLIPLISCSDTTVYLDANGTVRWDTSYLSLILSDNCGIDSVWLSENSSDCSNASISVTTYVRDNSGNIDSCESEVRTLDTTNPLISCSDTTVYLDVNGAVSWDTSYLSLTLSDNCGIDSVWISENSSDCSNASVLVTTYVRDNSGNIDSCESEVRILDTINPLINCSDTTVYLDANGAVSWDTSYLSLTLADNCGIDSVWISENSSDCSNASVLVTTYIRDNSGNIDSCESEVRILDTINPLISCSDTTVYLDVNGDFSLDTSFIVQFFDDNCGIDSIWLSKYQFDCDDLGKNEISAYIRDNSGNVDSCKSIVTIQVYYDIGKNGANDTAITLCRTDDNVQLFDVFTPQPQTNGWWSNNKSVVIPRTDASFIAHYIMPISACERDTLSIDVTIVDNPVAEISVLKREACLGDFVSFTKSSNLNETDCSWEVINYDTYDCADTLFPIINSVGTFDIKLIVTNSAGCTDTTTLEKAISIHENAEANFSFEYDENTGSQYIEFINESYNSSLYDWSVNQQVYDNTIDYQHFFDVKDGLEYEIKLKANNVNNCPDSTTAIITLKDNEDFFIPNSFSPNFDGINDVFYPVHRGYKITSKYLFIIYNRWGEEIFETNNPSDGWDGMFNGSIVQQGVYVWKMKVGDKIRTGHITVLR